jgi:hypothetical protein
MSQPNALTEWFPGLLAGAMGLGFVGVLIVIAIATWREHQQWEDFAKGHECRLVERRKGDVEITVAPIVGANGSMSLTTGVTFDDAQTAYVCNDGVKYWR